MKTETIKKMSKEKRAERASLLREAAEQITSCISVDSIGAAKLFMEGDERVANHLGSLNAPRWMKPLIYGDPQSCSQRLISVAETYE